MEAQLERLGVQMLSFAPDSDYLAGNEFCSPYRSPGFLRKICSSIFSRSAAGTSPGLITRVPKTMSLHEGTQVCRDVARTHSQPGCDCDGVRVRLKIFHARPRRVP